MAEDETTARPRFRGDDKGETARDDEGIGTLLARLEREAPDVILRSAFPPSRE